MGRKNKGRNRNRQRSTRHENEDEEQPLEGRCRHLKDAVKYANLNNVIPHADFTFCQDCQNLSEDSRKTKITEAPGTKQDAHTTLQDSDKKTTDVIETKNSEESQTVSPDNPSDASDQITETNQSPNNVSDDGPACDVQLDPALCVCLRCGHTACSRQSPHQHALEHYKAKNSHPLVVNLSSWVIWCYKCDDEIDPQVYSATNACLALLRKALGVKTNKHGKQSQRNNEVILSNVGSVYEAATIKGLANLGNTCFFNSVMQNLCQIRLLRAAMDHLLLGDFEYCLRPSKQDRELEPLSVLIREKPGPLTFALAKFLQEMASDSKKRVINPGNLFSEICKKASRFKGFRQQDSQELLRYLLDSVRTEEIKGVKQEILRSFCSKNGCKREEIAEKVDCNDREKIRLYGRCAGAPVIDTLFGGQLVSLVECLACHKISTIMESFFDLSLSLANCNASSNKNFSSTKKNGKQNIAGKNNKTKTEDESTVKHVLSKHQQKKKSKEAKKERKKAKRTNSHGSKPGRKPSKDDEKGKTELTDSNTTEPLELDEDVFTNSENNTTFEENGITTSNIGKDSCGKKSEATGVEQEVSKELEGGEGIPDCLMSERDTSECTGESRNENAFFVDHDVDSGAITDVKNLDETMDVLELRGPIPGGEESNNSNEISTLVNEKTAKMNGCLEKEEEPYGDNDVDQFRSYLDNDNTEMYKPGADVKLAQLNEQNSVSLVGGMEELRGNKVMDGETVNEGGGVSCLNETRRSDDNGSEGNGEKTKDTDVTKATCCTHETKQNCDELDAPSPNPNITIDDPTEISDCVDLNPSAKKDISNDSVSSFDELGSLTNDNRTRVVDSSDEVVPSVEHGVSSGSIETCSKVDSQTKNDSGCDDNADTCSPVYKQLDPGQSVPENSLRCNGEAVTPSENNDEISSKTECSFAVCSNEPKNSELKENSCRTVDPSEEVDPSIELGISNRSLVTCSELDSRNKNDSNCHDNADAISPVCKQLDLGKSMPENSFRCNGEEVPPSENNEEMGCETDCLLDVCSNELKNTELKDTNSHDGVREGINSVNETGDGLSKLSEILSGNHSIGRLLSINPNKTSVESCLSMFCSPEILDGNNKFICEECNRTGAPDEDNEKIEGDEDVQEKCNDETSPSSGDKTKGKRQLVYTEAVKQLLIYQPPPILTLHLKRFHQVGFALRKLPKHIDFQLTLDLSPFCHKSSKVATDSQGKVLYSLCGVVEHSGSLHSGHYTAYCRLPKRSSDFFQTKFENLTQFLEAIQRMWTQRDRYDGHCKHEEPSKGRWFHISDSHVSEVSEERVLKAQAYLLFYERMVLIESHEER